MVVGTVGSRKGHVELHDSHARRHAMPRSEELPAEVGVGLRGQWRGLVGTVDGVLPLDDRTSERFNS